MDKQTLYKIPTDESALEPSENNPLAQLASNDSLDSKSLAELNMLRTISVGKQRVCLPTLMKKVRKDIAYLNSRLEQLEQTHKPNTTMKKNYLLMLRSRESVLVWIESQMSRVSRVEL